MLGLMQDGPLLISGLLTYAERRHPRREVVSRCADDVEHRYDYQAVAARCRRLASALEAFGVRPGERVGSLAMNTHRHFELYFGVSGLGAVLHTVNPRLADAQLRYVIGHAEDRILFLDPAFVPLAARLAPSLRSVEAYVVLADAAATRDALAKTADAQALAVVVDYETFVGAGGEAFNWPTFDERTASTLCYTSGTTGEPKGVLFSHRSTVLHALGACQPSAFGIGSDDVLLALPPLFHGNAWSLPYLAAMTGAKLVLPGPKVDGASLCALIRREGATFTVGVPTLFTMLLEHLRSSGEHIDSLTRVAIGGSAASAALIAAIEETLGCEVLHLWGMTETSPLGTIATATAEVSALDSEAKAAVLQRQGRMVYGLEVRVGDGDGEATPATPGRLWVRGPWVASGYFKREEPMLDAGGWFPTGDIGQIDAHGYLKITDREKDLIKSGGEWISSIDVETQALDYAGVREAALIAARHPKWEERPVLVVTPQAGAAIDTQGLLGHLGAKLARWQLPDAVIVIDALPLTATGKVSKLALRERFADALLAQGAS